MKRILIVEDDALLNKTLAYNLTSDGHEVTPALNVRTAAGFLTEADYDLVLLDVNLPDGSGFWKSYGTWTKNLWTSIP